MLKTTEFDLLSGLINVDGSRLYITMDKATAMHALKCLEHAVNRIFIEGFGLTGLCGVAAHALQRQVETLEHRVQIIIAVEEFLAFLDVLSLPTRFKLNSDFLQPSGTIW